MANVDTETRMTELDERNRKWREEENARVAQARAERAAEITISWNSAWRIGAAVMVWNIGLAIIVGVIIAASGS